MQIVASDFFLELEKNLGEISCFVTTPTFKLSIGQVEDLGDLVTRARCEIAFLEKKIKDLDFQDKSSSKKNDQLLTSLSNYKVRFRQLVLDSKKKADHFHQENLLGNISANSKASRRQSKQITAVRAAASITEGLKRTSNLLESEIKKSATSYQALAESSKVLQETRQAYGIINDVMQQSRTLLSGLEWSELLDYFVLFVGFFIFSSTVAYVVSKRTYIPIPSPMSVFYLSFYLIQKVSYMFALSFRTLFGVLYRTNAAPAAVPSSLANIPTHTISSIKYGMCPASTFASRFSFPTCGLTQP